MRTLKILFTNSLFLLLSISVVAQTKVWTVPPDFKTMKNPVAVSDAGIKAGQSLYAKTCAACHGKTGLGDGPKAKSLKTKLNDLSKAEYQNQSDGEQFYKTRAGRGDMPKYEGKISDEDIWNIVNYMRTFKK